MRKYWETSCSDDELTMTSNTRRSLCGSIPCKAGNDGIMNVLRSPGICKKTLRRCSTGNMGVGRIYFQGGANTIFPVGETVAQFHFVNTDSTRNTFVSSKVIRETANCKIQGVTLPFHPFRRPWWGDVLFSTSQQKPSGEAQCESTELGQ